MMGQEAELGEVVGVVVAGGIGKRGRKMNGDQGVVIEENEGMMMVHLEGVVLHPRGEAPHQGEGLHQEVMVELGEGGMPPQEDLHQGVEEVEMMVLQEEVHHQEEISEKEMVGVLGDQVQGTIHHVTAVVQEVEEGISVKGEGLHQGVDLPQGEGPLQDVALHPAEDPVTMDLLTGAVTDLLLVTTPPLPNLADQPVITKTKAGQLSSVSPEYSWDYPGSRDICQITRSCHASRILLAPVT